jgi:hypothetical protein
MRVVSSVLVPFLSGLVLVLPASRICGAVHTCTVVWYGLLSMGTLPMMIVWTAVNVAARAYVSPLMDGAFCAAVVAALYAAFGTLQLVIVAASVGLLWLPATYGVLAGINAATRWQTFAHRACIVYEAETLETDCSVTRERASPS